MILGRFSEYPVSCLNPFAKEQEKPEDCYCTPGLYRSAAVQKRLDCRYDEEKGWVLNQPVIVLEGFKSEEYVGALASAFCYEAVEYSQITQKPKEQDGNIKSAFVFDCGVAHDYLYFAQGFDWRKELLNGVLDYAQDQGYEEILINTSVSHSHLSLRDMLRYTVTQVQEAEATDGDIKMKNKLGDCKPGSSKWSFRQKIEGSAVKEICVRRKMPDLRLQDRFGISKEIYAESMYNRSRGSSISSEGVVNVIRADISKLKDYLEKS
ncbi:hypothetical protein GF327_05315 [Candidatus Woesearchaeota archaeon]|nr:hypothetical protein [Candidatus Woesearchaeota archaeon]